MRHLRRVVACTAAAAVGVLVVAAVLLALLAEAALDNLGLIAVAVAILVVAG